jgi:hypothetical protein
VDALASQIKAALDGAAFDDHRLSKPQALGWILQAGLLNVRAKLLSRRP